MASIFATVSTGLLNESSNNFSSTIKVLSSLFEISCFSKVAEDLIQVAWYVDINVKHKHVESDKTLCSNGALCKQ